MNFTIASNNDPRVNRYVGIMNNNTIWEMWFKRDMLYIYNNFNGKLPPWATQAGGAKPEWKLYYLWARLSVSATQWAFFKQRKRDILRAYPGATDLKFDYFNTFTVEFPNETLQFNLDEQWSRIITQVASTHEQAQMGKYMITSPYNHRLSSQNYLIVQYVRNLYGYSLDEPASENVENQAYILISMFKSLVIDIMINDVYLTGRLLRSEYIDRKLRDFPRKYEKTKIFVGDLCAGCKQNKATIMCLDCNLQYCSEKCH